MEAVAGAADLYERRGAQVKTYHHHRNGVEPPSNMVMVLTVVLYLGGLGAVVAGGWYVIRLILDAVSK